MYALTRESGHIVWRERWYALTLGASLWSNLYTTHEDHVFVANVVVTDTMWEIVASNVISWPTSATVEHNVIAKIRKYRGFHEGHHFILMATEVHGTPGVILIISLRSVPIFFTIDNQKDRQSKGHLSLSFCIQFFKQCVSIVLHNVLASTIERKIVLASDVNSRPPITSRSHDLHVSDIRRVVGEITSYHERDPLFWLMRVVLLLAFPWPSLFVSFVMVLAINLLLNLCMSQFCQVHHDI